jgi:stage II sporulation protein D
MTCTAQLYTPRRPGANRSAPRHPAPPRRRRGWAARALAPALAAALALASPAGAEETIRVLTSSSPRNVVELRLEDYVAGVVSGEMPASFPPEALKAQAVAARSYALTRKIEAKAGGRGHDIAAGVLAQVWTDRPGPAARSAAEATAGEVLALGMEPVEAYFHASCGGRTEGGLAAIGRDLPYLASVPCGRCDGAPRARWKVEVPAREVGRLVGLAGDASSARITARSPTGRAERVELEGAGARVALSAADLRQRLGFSRLPSLAFEVRAAKGALVFEGAGQGHGAGLCQWGAAGLAREGRTYREILAHYYPGTDVVRMY